MKITLKFISKGPIDNNPAFGLGNGLALRSIKFFQYNHFVFSNIFYLIQGDLWWLSFRL